MNRRLLQLFRAWLPSWRFFETLSEPTVLFYRFAPAEGTDLSDWRPALQRPPRRWYSILLNGEGNLHLACYALVDQLEEDLGELGTAHLDALSKTPSYQLVQNLICFLLRERNELSGGCRYQFKVSRIATAGAAAPEEILISPVHSV